MSSYRKFTFAISSPDEFLVFLEYVDRPVSRCQRVSRPITPLSPLLLRAAEFIAVARQRLSMRKLLVDALLFHGRAAALGGEVEWT